MSRLRLSLRECRWIVATAIFCAAWWSVTGLALPLWDRLSVLEERASVSRKKLDRLQELAARRPTVEQAYARHRALLVPADQSEEQLQRALLETLEELARSQQLQIDLRPRPVQDAGGLRRVGVELTLDATQERVLAFLDQLLSVPHLLEIERLRLAANASPERPLRLTLTVNHLLVRQSTEP